MRDSDRPAVRDTAFGAARAAPRLAPGDTVPTRDLVTVHGETVRAPTPGQLTHLQFRRFAGCPICDLHLHTFRQRASDLEVSGVREVVFFHSSAEALRPYTADLPFAVIPDPERRQYQAFGVEVAPRSLLDPRAWPAILGGMSWAIWQTLWHGRTLPPTEPEGSRLGLPADFLLDEDGRVLACKYGEHAADHWSVEEVLHLAGRWRQDAVAAAPEAATP